MAQVYICANLFSVTVQSKNKLNSLKHLLPEGLLVDAGWMEGRGYSRSLRSQYVAAGWLVQPVRGVYKQPLGHLGWEQVVISLQTLLKHQVSVGGRTALEQQGYGHYLYMKEQLVHLYSDEKLPGWLTKLPDCPEFVIHNRSRFLPKITMDEPISFLLGEGEGGNAEMLPASLMVSQWGHWKWPMVMSIPERAILEVMDELPTRETFESVDKLMEGLVSLRPRRLQTLLEETNSVKVKRLFFYFADRHNHQWLARLDRDKIDLGAGKRVIYKGGKLDNTYQITVPEDMDAL